PARSKSKALLFRPSGTFSHKGRRERRAPPRLGGFPRSSFRAPETTKPPKGGFVVTQPLSRFSGRGVGVRALWLAALASSPKRQLKSPHPPFGHLPPQAGEGTTLSSLLSSYSAQPP